MVTIGYNVTYEFGGHQYSVQIPNDPGPTILLQVSPVGAQSQTSYQGNVAVARPEYRQQPTVIESRTIYQPYYEVPYHPSERFHHRHEWRGDQHRYELRY
jgi:hypothetical protein